MAKKSRPATEAGITIETGKSRKRKWPLHQWRQAIRTGLNWYWGDWGWLTIDVEIGDKTKGRRVRFVLHSHGGATVEAWFTELCEYGISHSSSEVVCVAKIDDSEHLAAQLLRFTWNREVQVLVVPVKKAQASFDIKDGKVTLCEVRGVLGIYGGYPPAMMSE
jgi:hypothetical protein